MSHEIMMINGKACIAVREGSELPWHRLANWTPADASMDVWGENSGLNYKVQRAVVRFPTSAADASNPDSWASWPDRHVLLHSVTKTPLGIVSDGYKIFQPRQMLQYIYDTAQQHGLMLDVMGVLFDGRKCWALANYDSGQSVLDSRDKVKGYLLVSTSFDGTSATEFRNTTVRVVCRNTLEVAARGKAAYHVRHRTTVDTDKANIALGLNVDNYREAFSATMDDFRKLAARPWTPAMMARATLELFKPAKVEVDDMSERERESILSKRVAKAIADIALGQGQRRLIGSDMRGGAGTAYAWLNAATQHVDHTSAAHSVESRWDSALMGRGADLKNRAFDVAMALIA